MQAPHAGNLPNIRLLVHKINKITSAFLLVTSTDNLHIAKFLCPVTIYKGLKKERLSLSLSHTDFVRQDSVMTQ